MGGKVDPTLLGVLVALYLSIIVYLAYYSWKRTRTAEDFMVAGRGMRSFIMALSYGATFISTSAIIGFGGIAAMWGMSLLWLTFLNIFVGILIAFAIFGKRTRKIGKNLKALTFPELLAKRFQSRFIQGFSALVIFLFISAYTSIVLIGGARFVEESLAITYNTALALIAVIVVLYVLFGGLRAVMYTDALQAGIMFVGMLLLLIATYSALGGFISAHESLTELYEKPDVQEKISQLKKFFPPGFSGWTSMPESGSVLWYILITTIILGVGIGVLAQPQLAVRFMTAKDNRALNRGVLVGGIFILMMTGVAFTVGPLSNAYFYEKYGKLSIEMTADEPSKYNWDKIMPIFINDIMPTWFVYLFMLTLIAAAMSTVDSLFHVQGTSLGRDFYRAVMNGDEEKSFLLSRVGVVVGVVFAIILAYKLPPNIIAIATAFWFGLCASTFLPAFVAALYWKRATKQGVIAGMLTGFFTSMFWYVFVHKKEAAALGICEALFGKTTLLGMPWMFIDPLIVALPLAALVTVVVSLATKPMSEEHIKRCFE